MRTIVTRLTGLLYSWALRFFPRPFREEFSVEMAEIFSNRLAEKSRQGALAYGYHVLSEFSGLVRALPDALQYSHRPGKELVMMTTGPANSFSLADKQAARPARPIELVAGVLPFVLAGFALVAQGLDKLHLTRFAIEYSLDVWLVVILLLAGGLCAGWVRGFPRWSLASLGLLVLFSADLAGRATYDQHSLGIVLGPGQRWGVLAWLPLIGSVLAGVVITRSLRPLLDLGRGVWQDWTRLSFFLYSSLMPFLLVMSVEDVRTRADVTHLVLLSLILGLGGLFYLLARNPAGRTLSLLAGQVVMISTALMIGAWQIEAGSRSMKDMTVSLVGLAVWVVFVCLPAVSGWIYLRFARPQRKPVE